MCGLTEFNEEVSDLLIKEVQKEAETDPDYQLLKNAVMAGDYRVCSLSNWTLSVNT